GANIGLGVAKDCISYIDNLDKRLPDIKSRINSCLIEINDVADTLTEILDGLNFDDREADKIADRLERIKALKRKYGQTYQDIMRYLEKTKKEYDKLKNASERIADLLLDIDFAKQEIKKIGGELTKARKDVAQQFSKKITDELRNLGMENAQFDVMFKEGDFEELLSKNGLDEVEFMFSANLGEPLMPLIKVISGGEMSRFMLGLKSITAELDSISTLVFDEIDTGISGKIAHVVAEKFVKISKTKQLIIITHLPQIAATGDNNLLISKSAVDGHTETKIKSLNGEEKILELVRLSGAKEANDIAITSAKQLEEHYSNIKSITY
ncbi:MAG: DNA repair protein RecN, partial [Clostridia bacterium]|nr:DNA repair protein RecN [Clostridia bacterium]